MNSTYFSEGNENFDFWEFAKRKKKERRKRDKGAGTGVLLYPLRPFRPFLIKALQKVGVPVKTTGKGLKRKAELNGKTLRFGPLVYLFAKHVIKEQPYNPSAANNYMEAYDFYDCYDHADEKSNANEKRSVGAAIGAAIGGAGSAAASAVPGGGLALGLSAGLVKAIIDWIKNLRDRKRRGEKLSERDQKLADLYDQTESEIKESAQDLAEEKIGETLLEPTTLLIIAAVVVAAIVFLRKK